MLEILKKIVGTKNDRELKKLWPIVAQVNALEPEFLELSADALRAKTVEFRERLAGGATLDDVLPEAFAAVREASRRTTGMRHFDVQLLGGMVLHSGRISEMKTGEGKTLVATSALYLNALEGKGAHLITVNDYLARRDVQWMGPIYHALGLSVASIIHDASYLYDPTFLTKDYRFVSLRPIERKEAYAADITYGTNNEFGFDYLRDNMKFSLEEYVQRELHFAIVDEVDNILVDEARTPLIISGPAEDSTDKYHSINRIIPRLAKEADYTIDEKHRQVLLTDEGVGKVERVLGISNLYDPTEIDTLHHVVQALRAHVLFKRDVDYVVKDGGVLIVDEFTGRLMPGRRWSDGLHQAVEAKEGVKIERENQTLATITIQNYFRMYKKLAGMTGTADTEAVEFKKIYNLEVMVIPPNRSMVRKDLPDVVYRTEREKFDAVIAEIEECAEKGQPVLVGTISVEKSERLSKLLKKKGVRHNVLNAVNHELEASIIAQAGRFSAVTIATNMAGRGTDILLGGNPEFLARAEMENEWIQRVAKLANPEAGPAKRYEDALREIREKYEEEVERIRRHYEPTLKEHDEKRRLALQQETESRQRLLEASPFRPLRERYVRRAEDDLIPAIGDGRPISEAYERVRSEMEETLLEAASAAPGASELRAEFEGVRQSFTELLQEWKDQAGRNANGLADRVNSARVHFDRVREDLEFLLLRDGGNDLDHSGLYAKAAQARLEAEQSYHEVERPFEKALSDAYHRYEASRAKYVKAVDEIRLQLDSAPHEFEVRFAEIRDEYTKTCAEERGKVVEAGGLHIIGTERHESRRIDNQLRGRAGRQGDAGSSRFYLSLEDDLMRIFGADRIQGLMQKLGMEEGVPIEHRLINRAVSNAQSKVEAHNFDIRKHLLEYDDVMNKQREVVYDRRRGILSGEGLREEVLDVAEGLAESLIESSIDPEAPPAEWDWKAIEEAVLRQFNVRLGIPEEERDDATKEELVERTIEGFRALYAEKEQRFTSPILGQLEKIIMLQTLDQLWKDHLLTMDHLKEGIGLRGYGQKNPLQEFKREGYDFFEQMMGRFESDVVQRLATVQLAAAPAATQSGGQRFEATFGAPGAPAPSAAAPPPPAAAPATPAAPPPSAEAVAVLERLEQRQRAERERRRVAEGNQIQQAKTDTIRRDADKVGRNDPCPCGSGKKYKKCHGA